MKFGKFTWLSYFQTNMRMVNKFQVGRAFVVCDAGRARAVPPGGEGLNVNCSVQDTESHFDPPSQEGIFTHFRVKHQTNLSWKLALVLNLRPRTAIKRLLSTYDDERLPVIDHRPNAPRHEPALVGHPHRHRL